MLALLVGRFHALTRAQDEWIASLGRRADLERIVCVLTSSDHAGTRRNPLDVETREAIVRPALAATGKPFQLVRVADLPDDAAWVAHVTAAVERATGIALAPSSTRVFTANREVDALFAARGFVVASSEVPPGAPTPHELIERLVVGRSWRELASPSTLAVYSPALVERLRALFAPDKLTDDGELAAHRDFTSYGGQMDASLGQKLDDLLPWVRPGRVVDKGCGTGKLLVELARRFPSSAFVGVDLSRELLRRCDENTYAAGDVSFVRGEAAEAQVAPGSATTVIFSSVMHEIYSYSGYSHAALDQALATAARELAPGGRVLVRDGVSPDEAVWRLQLLDEPTRVVFDRFAREFKRGKGAPHQRLAPDHVRLSAHLANEFLCKKDYLVNWHIEVHEEYGTLTVDGWRAALARAGFRPLHVAAYVNDWIAEHRYAGTVALTDDDDRPLPWPATNVVAVGERT
jgi:SAM-dependent methyltransferase